MATLLIVDDDSNIRETLHELLSQEHECHTADRAEQALAYLEIEHYDAILTDISMPRLSGDEVLKFAQSKHPATPVIVISGHSDQERANELMSMGAFAFINKPFHLEVIEDTVNRALLRHRELLEAQHEQTSQTPPEEAVG